MLSARFLLLPHRDLTADHDQATKTSPYLVPPPSVLKYPTLSPAFPPPHLRFHGAFVQWIDVTQAPSEYFRRKAAVSDLGSVIASQLASPKVRISSHGLDADHSGPCLQIDDRAVTEKLFAHPLFD
jgi:hypothetical protein